MVYIFARATLLMTLFCVYSLVFWCEDRRWRVVMAFAEVRADFGKAIELDGCLFDARQNILVAGVSTETPEDCLFSDEQRRRLTRNPPDR